MDKIWYCAICWSHWTTAWYLGRFKQTIQTGWVWQLAILSWRIWGWFSNQMLLLVKWSWHYFENHNERFNDHFSFFAGDPGDSKSIPLVVNIRIIPVNDHQVEFVDNLQTTIWLEENSQTCLSLQNLDATDADIGRDSILFEIVRRPIRGQLLTRGETAQQFDRSDLSSGVICYKHVGEIGNQIVVDQFDIIAKDQLEWGSKYLSFYSHDPRPVLNFQHDFRSMNPLNSWYFEVVKISISQNESEFRVNRSSKYHNDFACIWNPLVQRIIWSDLEQFCHVTFLHFHLLGQTKCIIRNFIRITTRLKISL